MTQTVDDNVSHTASSLVDIVRERPGIHFRSLARQARISSMGQLRHHVDSLRRRGILIEVEDGRYKRFFLAGSHPPAVRRTLARFSRPVPQRIGKLLLWRPMSRAELRRSLGCADSTLGYHLSRMSLNGDIVKTDSSMRCRYALADPETVRVALIIQSSGSSPPAREGERGSQDVAASVPAERPAAVASVHAGEARAWPGQAGAFDSAREEKERRVAQSG